MKDYTLRWANKNSKHKISVFYTQKPLLKGMQNFMLLNQEMQKSWSWSMTLSSVILMKKEINMEITLTIWTWVVQVSFLCNFN